MKLPQDYNLEALELTDLNSQRVRLHSMLFTFYNLLTTVSFFNLFFLFLFFWKLWNNYILYLYIAAIIPNLWHWDGGQLKQNTTRNIGWISSKWIRSGIRIISHRMNMSGLIHLKNNRPEIWWKSRNLTFFSPES